MISTATHVSIQHIFFVGVHLLRIVYGCTMSQRMIHVFNSTTSVVFSPGIDGIWDHTFNYQLHPSPFMLLVNSTETFFFSSSRVDCFCFILFIS